MKQRTEFGDITTKLLYSDDLFKHPDWFLFVEWWNNMYPNDLLTPDKFNHEGEGFGYVWIYQGHALEPNCPWRQNNQQIAKHKRRNGYNLCPLCKSNRKAWYAKKCRQCFLATK